MYSTVKRNVLAQGISSQAYLLTRVRDQRKIIWFIWFIHFKNKKRRQNTRPDGKQWNQAWYGASRRICGSSIRIITWREIRTWCVELLLSQNWSHCGGVPRSIQLQRHDTYILRVSTGRGTRWMQPIFSVYWVDKFPHGKNVGNCDNYTLIRYTKGLPRTRGDRETCWGGFFLGGETCGLFLKV